MSEHYFIFIIIFIILLTLRQFSIYKKNLTIKYIFTPLITITSAITALISLNYTSERSFGIIIIAGLVLSLAGDVLMMIEEKDFFTNGLLFFFLAHLAYILALISNYHFSIWNIIPAVVLIISISYFYITIKRKTKKHDIPVLIYMFIIGIMFYFAICRFNAGYSTYNLLFLLGAALFVVSDVLLAINKFIRNIPYSTIIVWMFYAPAQMLIGLSSYYI